MHIAAHSLYVFSSVAMTQQFHQSSEEFSPTICAIIEWSTRNEAVYFWQNSFYSKICHFTEVKTHWGRVTKGKKTAHFASTVAPISQNLVQPMKLHFVNNSQSDARKTFFFFFAWTWLNDRNRQNFTTFMKAGQVWNLARSAGTGQIPIHMSRRVVMKLIYQSTSVQLVCRP